MAPPLFSDISTSFDYVEDILITSRGCNTDFEDVRLRIRELPMSDGVHASTGCQLWTTSIVLARELFDRPDLIKGKSVIEVGAGCGLLGICAASLARRILITDGDEEAVQNLDFNLELNSHIWKTPDGEPRASVSTRTLLWEDVIKDRWNDEDRADVILASDIIYGHWGETVSRALIEMLAPGGLIFLAASEDRRSGVRGFKDSMRLGGFNVKESKLALPCGNFRFYECWEPQPGEPALEDKILEREEPAYLETLRLAPEPPAKPIAKTCVGEAKEESAIVDATVVAAEIWRVVGGANRGGIIVRSGEEYNTTKIGRLEHGALLERLSSTESRLEYRKVRGEGPATGWVSLFLNNMRLIERE